MLGLSPIGRHDNFFELGGHSLLVLRLFREIHALMHCDLPLSALFQDWTIESLAALLRQKGGIVETLRCDSASDNNITGLSAAQMVDATVLDATVRSRSQHVNPARKNAIAGAGLRLGTTAKRAWQGIYRFYGIRNNVVAGPGLRLGVGSVIGAPRGMEIGRDVSVGKFCTIECDGRIGDFVMIAKVPVS